MDEEESFDSYKARVDRIATLLEKAIDCNFNWVIVNSSFS
jgi:hypothetical protein